MNLIKIQNSTSSVLCFKSLCCQSHILFVLALFHINVDVQFNEHEFNSNLLSMEFLLCREKSVLAYTNLNMLSYITKYQKHILSCSKIFEESSSANKHNNDNNLF